MKRYSTKHLNKISNAELLSNFCDREGEIYSDVEAELLYRLKRGEAIYKRIAKVKLSDDFKRLKSFIKNIEDIIIEWETA